MNWSDSKKWSMELFSKLILATVIAILAAGATFFLENRFKVQMEKNRYHANRIEARARMIESTASNFLEISFAYADAFRSAFNDVWYDDYGAKNKGVNQLRYENQLNPKFSALSHQLKSLCPNTSSDMENLSEIRKNAFCFYNLYEGSPNSKKKHTCQKPEKPVDESIYYSKEITDISVSIYKSTLTCIQNQK